MSARPRELIRSQVPFTNPKLSGVYRQLELCTALLQRKSRIILLVALSCILLFRRFGPFQAAATRLTLFSFLYEEPDKFIFRQALQVGKLGSAAEASLLGILPFHTSGR